MRRKTGNLFLTNNSTAAYYDHGNFYITLNQIAEDDLKIIRENPNTAVNIEHLKTIQHEARHFVDHFCTLWGQRNLLKYIKAINARLETNVARFKDIIEYCIECNQIFYTSYYTEEYTYIPVDSMDKRWKWQASTGLRFDSKGATDPKAPLLMVRFSAYDDTPLFRIPVSVVSLFETNAKAEEIKLHLGYIASMAKRDQEVHLKIFQQETLLKLIYNQDLALYNVAVHLAANCLKIGDMILAFQVASEIATLALNLPNSVVRRITIPKGLEVWGDRNGYMVANNEYGFIYYLLLQNYRSAFMEKGVFDISDVLRCSGLPEYDAVVGLVNAEIAAIQDEMKTMLNFGAFFYEKSVLGQKVLNKAGLGYEKEELFEPLLELNFVPKIICNDTTMDIISYRPSDLHRMRPITSLSDAEWYNFAADIFERLTEFYEIRGI